MSTATADVNAIKTSRAAEEFIFAAGHVMGILHRLTDQDLEQLEAWAAQAFAPELGHVAALLQAERARRAAGGTHHV